LNKVCNQVVGAATRCIPCKTAHQACQYLISGAADVRGEKVGKIIDAAEESDEESEEQEVEEVEEEEESTKKTSPIVSALKKIASPLRNLGKRKPTELSPKTIDDRDSEASERARARTMAVRQSPELGDYPESSASLPLSAMPPPSSISGSSGPPLRDFYTRRLEIDLQAAREYNTLLSRRLRDSQEDLHAALARHESRESLLTEEVLYLRGIASDNQSQSSSRGGGRRGARRGM
jgi:hypothetical protein